MNLAEFKQQVEKAGAEHFPQAKTKLEERHGAELHDRVEIDDMTLIDVYYSAVTGKTSYTLVRANKRVFGYDNFRFWHRHPLEDPDGHIPCEEPSPDRVFREIRGIVNLKSKI
jgi:hypothetical protein